MKRTKEDRDCSYTGTWRQLHHNPFDAVDREYMRVIHHSASHHLIIVWLWNLVSWRAGSLRNTIQLFLLLIYRTHSYTVGKRKEKDGRVAGTRLEIVIDHPSARWFPMEQSTSEWPNPPSHSKVHDPVPLVPSFSFLFFFGAPTLCVFISTEHFLLPSCCTPVIFVFSFIHIIILPRVVPSWERRKMFHFSERKNVQF